MSQVIVIGAGIAGLTAAYTLQQQGVSVEVIEAASRVGGRMTTDILEGYIIDRGAQFLSSEYSLLSNIITTLGLQNDFIKTSPWAAIRRGGKIHRFRYADVLSPLKSNLLNGREWFKLGLASAKYAPALTRLPINNYSAWADFDTENAADWYNAQYGVWMTEYLIEPMLEGFYFQSPEETSRALPMAVSGFLARGAHTMTLRGGIESLATGLGARLRVSLNERVENILVEKDHVCIRTTKREFEAPFVICATPAHITKEIGAGKLALLDTPYASTLNLALGISKKWTLPEAMREVYGLLLPRQERQHIAAIAVETAKSTDRAVDGHLLNVMLDGKSGAEMLAWDEQSILETLLPELEDVLPHISLYIVFKKLYRWHSAEPKSPVGRSQNIRAYRNNISPNTRILLAGDYMGMPFTEGAAETGKWAAEQILKKGIAI
ncbi:MAG: FAD-dependent oxidoreductase [Anaerolineales bacterium]|nr:FAD-dependent oxidoreductase [Anaerolineales bacterium]